MRHTVFYIEGDGVGPEIWQASRPVLDKALEVDSGGEHSIDWQELLAGGKALTETGALLPEHTLEALKSAALAIKGPLGTPIAKGFRSLNVILRQTLDLYACIRPVRHFPGVPAPVKHPERVDMIIFRENTEDLYAGIEYQSGSAQARKLIDFLRAQCNADVDGDAGIGIKPMTAKGSKRLMRKAIRYALDKGRKSVTMMHKGNIMKYTEGAFSHWGYEVAGAEFAGLCSTEAAPVPGTLIIKDRLADALFQEVLLKPGEFDIIAAPNLNGDYISDALAAQVGGLGMAPGVNMSDTLAFFEATHGTAPTLAGKDMANPCSFLLSGALMFEHMGHAGAAERLRAAIGKAIAARTVTPDLAAQMEGAKAVGCRAFADIIGAAL